MANDGIRRIEIAWSLGIGADTGLLVILLVTVYARDGVVATGLLGAVRMLPAVVAGMLSGALLERFRGERLLLAIGLVRAAAAALCGMVIAMHGDTVLLFGLAAVVATVGAPVRPIQATLVPALARSPNELVAANMAWSTGEGLGAFAGPLVVGILVAAGQPAVATLVTAAIFLLTAIVIAGLHFEHARDAAGGAGEAAGGLRLLDGLRALRRRPVPAWAMVSVFGQVMSRALLSS
ncbi:MAG: MFS transporter, partial [Candidatus Limnocylindrales bacterium]